MCLTIVLYLNYGIIPCLSFSPSRTTFDFDEYPEVGKKSMASWKNFNRGNMEQNLERQLGVWFPDSTPYPSFTFTV